MKKMFDNFSLLIPAGVIKTSDNIPAVSYSANPDRKLRHVWVEGYAATGESSDATYYGCCFANSHIEACQKLVEKLDTNPDGSLRLDSKGNPTVWACSCYDNEIDARKSFG